MKAAWCLLLVTSLGSVASGGKIIHVAADGDDADPGTVEKPLATIGKAVALAAAPGGPEEIVLHEGTYPGGIRVAPPAGEGSAKAPALLIRAAGDGAGAYEKVVIDGGRKVVAARPVKEAPHVFAVPCHLKDTAVSMWENDTRVRYHYMADVNGVSAHPGSLVLKAGQINFHTSDGRPPETHDIGVARDQYGFFIWRGNVTVQGLQFRSFINGPKGRGIAVYADNVTIRDCHAWNCRGAYNFHTVKNGRVLNCEAEDVGYGVFSYGQDTTVENCRFFREAGPFEVQLYNQDQAGIEYYHPAERGVIRRNLCVGFKRGIFLKCKPSAFRVEHNTVVADPGMYGIGCTVWRPETVCRYNIIQGYSIPFVYNRAAPAGTTIDRNCIWGVPSWDDLGKTLERLRSSSVGAGNFVAAPLFAGAQRGDYRPLHGSLCAALAAGGEPIGAFSPAGKDFRDRVPPQVRLKCAPPARYYGWRAERHFEKDPWHKKGPPEWVGESIPERAVNHWIIPSGQVVLVIEAIDNPAGPREMRLKIGDDEWSAPEPYANTKKIALPDAPAPVVVQVRVADAAGNWSEPEQITITPALPRIEIEGQPHVRTNARGAIISFATEVPCYARIEYAEDGKSSRSLPEAHLVRKDWDAQAGGEWIDTTAGPRKEHLFALIPEERPHNKMPVRIVLSDGLGKGTTAYEDALSLEGSGKTFCVGLNGQDGRERGSRNQPLKTLQYACDHALPGDTVVVLPGVYTGETILAHGGAEGAPIRLKSSEPGKAILDGGKMVASCLRLNESPYVEIGGFEIRWFTRAGIYLSASPHVTIRECFIWNDHHYGRRPVGDGLFCRRSPGLVLDHNVFFTLDYAFGFVESPALRMTHNTIANTLHGGGRFILSLQNSICRNNSITFPGNMHFGIFTQSPADMRTFDCDYNNLAMHIRKSTPRRPPPEKDIEPIKDDFFYRKTSKYLVSWGGKTYNSLDEWRAATGKDRHSIFENPQYEDPANHDFRLKPASPNVGAGERGATIGARGVAHRKP